MNTREKVLKEALNCVNGEREKQYGSPEDNFRRIADLWSTYLTSLFEDEKVVVDIDPIDVAKMMILFKIARSNGDKDKLDNYVDMIGYGACAAEIFENGESEDSYQYFMKKNFGKEASEAVNELKREGKKFAEKIFRPGLTPNYNLNNIELADECKDCDYAKKCMGTGVCLKEEVEKWFDCGAKKDRPDEKCNRKDCGQFDACMTAYQHYIYNKTKEASEATDKCMCEKANAFDQYGTNVLLDQKDPYSYAHTKLSNYVLAKAEEKHVSLEIENLKNINRKFPRELSDYLHQAATDCVENGKRFLDCYKEIDELFEKYVNSFWDTYQSISAHIISSSKANSVNHFDVVSWLTKNGHAPTEMASLLLVGRLNSDTVASYIEKAINEVKKEDKK